MALACAPREPARRSGAGSDSGTESVSGNKEVPMGGAHLTEKERRGRELSGPALGGWAGSALLGRAGKKEKKNGLGWKGEWGWAAAGFLSFFSFSFAK